MAEKMKKRIIVGATGASGLPLLVKCLEIIRENSDFESYLIMSSSAELTLRQETELEPEDVKRLADHVCAPGEIGAKPASGSFKTEGMLIVPCSMKTVAGIHSGYRYCTFQNDRAVRLFYCFCFQQKCPTGSSMYVHKKQTSVQ